MFACFMVTFADFMVTTVGRNQMEIKSLSHTLNVEAITAALLLVV
jgi:hypothetical protein